MVAIPHPATTQQGVADPYADYDEAVEGYDEDGLPNRTRTEYRRRSEATSPASGTGSGWGATEPQEPTSTGGWGGTVVDRTPGTGSRDPLSGPAFCDVSDQQFDLALRRADLAMAEGNIDRWFNAILPLVQAGCDRPELTQRIEQAGRMEAASDRRRDQQVADATRWSRSRLTGRTTLESGSAPSEWLEVANGLANLGLALRAAREGRPAPPPQTIISQGPDGGIAVTLPQQAPPPGPDPAIARAAEERRAEMLRMAEEARRASNLPSSSRNFLIGDDLSLGSSGDSSDPGGTSPSPPQSSAPPVSAAPPPPVLSGGPPPPPGEWHRVDPGRCFAGLPARPAAPPVCMCHESQTRLFGVPVCEWSSGGGVGVGPCQGPDKSTTECYEFLKSHQASLCAGDSSCESRVEQYVRGLDGPHTAPAQQ